MNAPTGKLSETAGFRVIGTRPVRPDGVDKVTGKAIYSPDFVAAGMIFATVLRSPHAHARIRTIDTSQAEALPGVKAVITGADFPDDEVLAAKSSDGDNMLAVGRHCMALDKALFEGHAVAAVAAVTQDIADAAAKLIVVDYEVLRPVMSVSAALAEDAPLLHPEFRTKGLDPAEAKSSNLALYAQNARGDAAAALAGAEVVVEGRYTTQPVHQGYIEPHACVAQWNADGQAQIWASSQGHFMIRSQISAMLGIPRADIRVTALEIGGGFGGKTRVFIEPVAMLLARKAGRPVRVAMSRADVFRCTGPATGGEMWVKLGARTDGSLVAAEVDIAYLSGAYLRDDVHSGMDASIGHYRVADFTVTGRAVFCNMTTAHAYRAPGAPQVVFAVESAMDELALKLGMDPLELRLKNIARPGDPDMSGLPYGAIGYVEGLEAAKAHPHWSAPVPEGQARGVACGGWGNYGGPSSAEVSVAEDGSITVTEGSPDIGGSRAAMAMMVAETVGIGYDNVRVTIADTNSVGYTMVTGGSRVTFATGKAVVQAAQGVVEELKKRAALSWGVDAAEVDWRDGAAWCGSGANAGTSLSIAQIAARAAFSGGPITVSAGVNAQGWLPGFAVHICDVALDRETGHVGVTRFTAVQDVGTAIHPDYVEGQMQGGVVQGIGWALNEEYVWDADGRMDNPGFLDYRMPVCSDVPMIDTVMVEVPNPNHPYGVKGVGEAPIVPPLAAVANAVSRAGGVRFHHLPLAPDRVYAGLTDPARA